jgi:sugar/nucleoside kinase (ribokinase family)
MKKLGVIGSMVWDEIHGRDPAERVTEEWGGIAYALAAFDASLPQGWEMVPLVKVGRDLIPAAQSFLRELNRTAPAARFIEVPAPNNRVTLRYETRERRCERMSGGVPGWIWGELGPMVRDLDAVYVNFISGFELGLGTAQALRQAFRGRIYADLHSLFLGLPQDGVRVLRPLPDAAEWFACFDYVQLNEDEMRQLSDDPLALAAGALAAGVSLLVVTLGPRGAVYVESPGSAADTVRTALVEAPRVEALDPTGCGDVLGAALFSRLLAGEAIPAAMAHAVRLAARNAAFRGAGGLSRHLQGQLLAV